MPPSTFELLSRAVAAARARESARPDRLFDDPLAARLAGAAGRDLLAAIEAVLPGGDASLGIAVRTRFFDDFLRAAAASMTAPQVVVLGAGMDTRAFRLRWPADTTLYEIDFPEILDNKEKDLGRGVSPACRRVLVRADLSGKWPEALVAAGFRARWPSVWLIEGLITWLEEAVVNSLLHALSRLASPSSRLAADVIGAAALRDKEARPLLDKLAALGTPWRFGTDEPERLFAIYGWDATVEQTGDVAHRLGIAAEPMPPRSVAGLPRDFLVSARRRGRR